MSITVHSLRTSIEVTGFSGGDHDQPLGVSRSRGFALNRHLSKAETRAYRYAVAKGFKDIEVSEVPRNWVDPLSPKKASVVPDFFGRGHRMRFVPTPTIVPNYGYST